MPNFNPTTALQTILVFLLHCQIPKVTYSSLSLSLLSSLPLHYFFYFFLFLIPPFISLLYLLFFLVFKSFFYHDLWFILYYVCGIQVEKKLNFCIFHLHVEFEVTNFTSDLESGFFWGKINFYFYFCYVHSQFPANNIVDGILEIFF
jgi:hypothetical protein